MAVNKEELIESIENMTVLELSELVKALEERFGVSATAVAAAPAAGAAGDGAAAAEEEQTEFDVVLQGPGEKKIQVIKVVRAATGLGLKEAKALVDEAPNPVKEALSREDADALNQAIRLLSLRHRARAAALLAPLGLHPGEQRRRDERPVSAAGRRPRT